MANNGNGGMKLMAQRNMLRGNRGNAQAITEFGVAGMRSNLLSNTKTTQKKSTQIVSKVNAQASAKNTASQVNTQKKQLNKKLGNSVLDALQ